VADYAAALASKTPAPGGGSAVAVSAALAAALAEMVCRYTIGKKAYKEHEPVMVEALAKVESARARFLQLAADDEVAYAQYAEVAALPKATEAERSLRDEAIQRALMHAATIPSNVAAMCVDLLSNLETIGQYGNRTLLSDVVVAAHLAEAALLGAVANVQANAALMHAREAKETMSLGRTYERRGRSQSASVQEIVASRLSSA
jgi:formiminotetrahydrofolate cyclodeaminase